MTDDMRAARDVAVKVIESPISHAWAFEYTPPSPADAPTAYLDAVARSDIFVWIVGASTSAPVELEVAEALRRSMRILVFRFPADDCDDRTKRLVGDVEKVVKYSRVRDLADFERQLPMALIDLIVKSVRDGQGARTASALDAMHHELRGFALGRWQATGVPVEKAIELFDDPNCGAPPAGVMPSQQEQVVILTGPVGSGKSLAAVRHAIRAVRARAEDPSHPVPVWVDTASQETVPAALRRSAAIDEPTRTGACIVIDGADEHGKQTLERYVEEALAARSGHSSTTVLLTCRSSSVGQIPRIPSAEMPALGFSEALELINRCFELKLTPWSAERWPPAVRDAMSRPLFAILLGRFVSSGSQRTVLGPAHLIDALVENAVQRTGVADTAMIILARLAAQSIDNDGRPVPASDAGSRSDLTSLEASRLITHRDGAVSFALPLLREWFGARAIDEGLVDLEHVAADEDQLERWRYPIYVAAATARRDLVHGLLGLIARTSPAFASEIIDAASIGWDVSTSEAAPASDTMERSFRSAYAAFMEGFAPLGTAILPPGATALDQVSVGAMAGNFTVGVRWDRVAIAPPGADLLGSPPGGWLYLSTARPLTEPLWVWGHARRKIRDRLELLMRPGRLRVPAMDAELVWAAAGLLAKIGSHRYAPIDRRVVEDALAALGDEDVVSAPPNVVIPLAPLRTLLASGSAPIISCPYPDRDGPPGGWDFTGFGPGILMERSRLVYQAALLIHAQLVETFFPRFAQRLQLNAMRPVRLVGRLIAGNGPEQQPELSHFFLLLAPGRPDEVDISLGTSVFTWDEVDALTSAVQDRRRRPPWIREVVTHGRLEVFGSTPATIMAIGWVREGFMRVGWQ
jgi:hypothetical protein